MKAPMSDEVAKMLGNREKAQELVTKLLKSRETGEGFEITHMDGKVVRYHALDSYTVINK